MSVPFFAKALFDYEAVEASELGVSAGDFLTVEEVNESGWCLARKGDANGWLPTDYVQKVESDASKAAEPIAVSKPQAAPLEIVATEGSSLVLPPGMASTPAQAAAAGVGDSPAADGSGASKGAFSGKGAADAVDELARAMAAASASAVPPASQAPAKAPTTDANGAPLKVCGFCNEGIRSAFVMAKGQAFHPNHFQCTTCHKELGGRAYLEKDDKFYCEDDYYAQFNPKCGGCNETIKGPYVSALDQAWHPEHFVCAECHQPFAGNQFRKHEDKPYCDAHFEALFAPKCASCGLGIAGQVFEALENKYHLACFKCAADDAPIGEGVMFHVHENEIYCPAHFEDLFLQKCHGCKQPIKGQYIKVMDFHYHTDCWTCTECKAPLKAETCALDNGEFFCRPCLSSRRQAPKPAAAAPQQVLQQMGANPQSVPSSVAPAAAKAAAAPAPAPAAAAAAPIAAAPASNTATAAPPASSSPGPSSAFADPAATKYTYAVLKDVASRPADVDPARREQYLSNEEFMQLFKMDREAFLKQADWKRKQQKQALGLF